MNNRILAIESSCDETAAAVYTTKEGLLSNEIYSQIEQHAKYGGVVPEAASREHMKKITIVTQQALENAKMSFSDIDTIAVTSKPGLPGSLMIGVSYAKALAYASNKKIIGIDHLEGHVFSACIEHKVPFPFLSLTVSGGHSALYLVHDYGTYEIIGYTLDDAAGEAFDKIAKLMNLPYPGGPVLEKLAQQQDFKDFFNYPRGSLKNLNFSFSGLKTAVLYSMVKQNAYNLKTKTFLKNNDKEFQQKVSSSLHVCIGDIFENKIKAALIQYPNIKAVCFVGGVACNKYLRKRLTNMCDQENIQLFYPSPKLCTDNAGMIAFVGHYKSQQQQFSDQNLSIL
ncbi:MAG: tRNA (adenosine(37)-N6)-threonylcarbamoyltransferase complex transferase subunit TsaD [Epsilonproteobacteria bacterium]|nr:tRNA (adenosine(37)-N6)-threonylcarbamoyltransferase complex transferase subunit TsaD [Campylobacterota bacterium]|tara:strand:- start:377 stop:1396 length:1020 start_codon:yes stop_codon:yes gene_type:complete